MTAEPVGHVYDRCACGHARHWHRGGTADCDRCGCDVFEVEVAAAGSPAAALLPVEPDPEHLDDTDPRPY